MLTSAMPIPYRFDGIDLDRASMSGSGSSRCGFRRGWVRAASCTWRESWQGSGAICVIPAFAYRTFNALFPDRDEPQPEQLHGDLAVIRGLIAE